MHIDKINNKISLPVKKISVKKEAPPCIRMEGSYMVELSVLLPFFAGFMVVLLFFFQVLTVQQEVENALLISGRELSVLAVEEGKKDSAVGAVMAKALVLKNIRKNSATEAFVRDGKLGISLIESDFSGDYIDLQANYKMRLPIGLFGKQDIFITQRLRCRKWTGNSGNADGDEEEKIVYITPNGSVYHMKRDCTAIKLSISTVPGSTVSGIRNETGGKYDACSKCMKNKNPHTMMVYVTKYGGFFHSSRSCSRIKRTVLAVRGSEVKKRTACSKCRGE